MTNPNSPEDSTMTSSQAPETAPDTTAGPDATETAPEAGEQAVEGGDAAALRAEAAKHRTKARAAEAERDALAATVAAFQRAEVERLLTRRLSAPGDIWLLDNVKLEDQLGEDGTVDKAKVDATLAQVLTDRPTWAAPRFSGRVPRDMGQGQRESGSGGVRSLQQILRG